MGWPAQMRGVADQQLVVSLSGRTNRTAGCPARTLTMHLVPRARAVPIFRRPGRGRSGARVACRGHAVGLDLEGSHPPLAAH
jgi:hypothetical protein